MFFKAEPVNTGIILLAITAFLKTRIKSSSGISSPARYFSIRASSLSAIASISSRRYFSASAFIFSGIGVSTTRSPLSPWNSNAFMRRRSTTPLKSPSAPIGNCTRKAQVVSLSLIEAKLFSKLAPMRSSLLMKQILGTLYSSA